jgi:hypothetical protein
VGRPKEGEMRRQNGQLMMELNLLNREKEEESVGLIVVLI